MEPLRRAYGTIRKQMGGMSASHKLLVGCVVVIVVLTLVVVAQVTGRASLVEVLPGADAAEQQRALSHLQSTGIDALMSPAGRVVVPSGDAARAGTSLAQANLLPGDKALYFENLLSAQSWMNSRQVNEQQFHIALENELARMIAGLAGVESARVRLDIPPVQGLGVGVRTPKASISVKSRDGRALAQSVVDGVARLVEGSVAGLTLDRVTVTDARTGANRAVTTEANAAPTLAMEHAARVEAQTQAKLQAMLAHIPGVVVTVTASVDVTRSTSQIQSYLPKGQGTETLPTKSNEIVNSSSEMTGSATPGVKANQTDDITRGGAGSGVRTESSDSNREFETRFGSKTETIVDPKGQSTSVAVSVNVPSGYVAGLLKAKGEPGAAGEAAGPDEAALADRFEKDVKPGIIASLTPHLRTMVAQANAGADPEVVKAMVKDSISVALVPGALQAGGEPQAAGLFGGGGGGSGSGGLGLGGGLVEKGVLVLLSLTAMGLMIVMVKKAGRKPETPSAEELVGLPPSLEAAGDVIGEAQEGETALAGIEVGAAELEATKRLEQVTELVGKDPESTAKTLSRWINVEE